MFMHKSKKGFTIVELVIVIAVIAILAAVLIPTFSNLVKKANIANDTALAKNINTALTAYKATNAGDMEFEDVIAAARDAGYIISNLNPTTAGHYFVWEKSTNQILLVDGENAYKVIYANNEKYAPIGENWYFATSDKAAATALKADSALASANIKDMIAKVEDLTAALAAGGTQEIYIDESVVLTSDKTVLVNDANAVVTLKLNGASLTTDGTITKIPVNVEKGQLTVEEAVVGGAGSFSNEHGSFSTAVGFDGDSKLTLVGCNIRGRGNAVSGANKVDGEAEVTLIDCTLFSDDNGLQMATWGTATLTNTNIEAPCPLFASYGGTINVKSGRYHSTTDCMIEIYDNTSTAPAGKVTTVNIEGGTFTFTTFAKFYGSSKIVITGGTFNGVDYLEYFKSAAAEAAITGGATINISGNTVTISK